MEDEESGWELTRIGVVLAGAGLLIGVSTMWLGASPGIVMKPDLMYDFVIVGGGTAGIVLANRLSEKPSYKVLLIEAGGEEPWVSSVPLAAPLLQKSKHDWQFRTVPQKYSQKALHNQESFWPRGKMLGGSNQINYNIHSFGSPQDFDIWENEYDAEGWGFEEMKKYANKAECLRSRPKILKEASNQCSNTDDPSKKSCEDDEESGHRRRKQDTIQCYEPYLRKTKAKSQLAEAFTQAGKELGLPVGSLNEDIDYGFMAAESSIYRGKRWGVVSGYLRPILGERENLHVVVNTEVTKIIWDGKRAVGVQYLQWDNILMNGTVFAKGEVILSAGVINTPKILVYSGVGPNETLSKLNISPEISHLEGVGKNLQDHLNLPLYVSLQSPLSMNVAKLRSFTSFWNYFVNGKGDLARSAMEGVAVVPVNGESPEVGVVLFNMGAVDKSLYSDIANIKSELFESMFPGMRNESSEGFILLATCLHPRSKGKLIFSDKDPRSMPLIQPNYLQHTYDLPCMRDAFRFAVKIIKSTSFEELGASLMLPAFSDCNQESKGRKEENAEFSRLKYQEYLSCIIKMAAITGYHPIGTARMGRDKDPMAVVDSSLKVRGVQRLRIIDASVMPSHVSGFPSSTIITMAEKASDLIKADWGDGSKIFNQKICSSSPDCQEIILKRLRNKSSETVSFSSTNIGYIIIGVIFIRLL